MDTNNLIKSVIQENIVETKKIAHELLMQKLSERLQSKFDEYAPANFLDESEEVEEQPDSVEVENESEEIDEEINSRRAELASLLEKKKHKKEKEEEEKEEEDEEEKEMGEYGHDDEEMGEDGLVYEDECEDCKEQENDAEEMNKKAFGIAEGLVGKQHKLDVAEPKGKLTSADFKALRKKKISEETEQLDEVSPPGMKKMTHSKKARESFKEQYGKKRGKSVQYATAWKNKNKDKKDE